MSWPELAGAAALGLAAGAVGSGLGVGTGGLVVPGLVLLFGLTEAGAQGTSLLVVLPTAVIGAWARRREGGIPAVRLSLAAGALGAGAALVGAWLALRLPARLLAGAFAAYLVLIGAHQVARGLRELRPHARQAER